MEERIIDDEYGRGVRLKKTKDGYVDVTDELAEEAETVETDELQEETGYDEGEEIAFEFPTFEGEDDEELVGLTPEEVEELKRQREEAAAKRKADYEQACKEGSELLDSGSFKAAELKFEKALLLDDEATEASVGYWRAKTTDFTQPDVLVSEYTDAGIENMEYDLGYGAVEILKKDYKQVFEKRLSELTEEEKPLVVEVEEKQARRRAILSARIKRSTLVFLAVALPTAALLTFAIIVGLKIFSTSGNEYVTPTILLAAGFFVFFIAFLFVTNKWINDLRMRRANERLSSTADGKRLVEIREYKELYAYLAGVDDETETAVEETTQQTQEIEE